MTARHQLQDFRHDTKDSQLSIKKGESIHLNVGSKGVWVVLTLNNAGQLVLMNYDGALSLEPVSQSILNINLIKK